MDEKNTPQEMSTPEEEVLETVESPAEEKPAEPEKAEEKPEGNAITKMYDKLPFTYKQVDIAVKVLIGVLAVILVYGFLTGTYSPLK